MALEYGKAKKIVLKTIIILAVITVVEVGIALTGKGYIIPGLHWPVWLVGIAMISLSMTKAYMIVYEFMHMKYEVPSLVRTVLLPTVLLIWALIAFLYEGADWNKRRELIQQKNSEKIETATPIGENLKEIEQEDIR